MLPYLVVIGAHVLCQVVYSGSMWFQIDRTPQRILWLLIIWGIPIFGIGVAGARFSRPGRAVQS